MQHRSRPYPPGSYPPGHWMQRTIPLPIRWDSLLCPAKSVWTGFASFCIFLLIFYSSKGVARPALIDNLDSPTLAFRLAPEHREAKLLEHDRVSDRAQFGRQAERIVLHSPADSPAALLYQFPKAPVIDELRMAVWVMSNRPGVRLDARVTLPRTNDPATKIPYQVTIRGTSTTQTGNWQKITLDQVPERLARQARVARLQYDHPLDERGAYIQELLLTLPGSKQPVELLVDRIEIEGVLQPSQGDSTIVQVSASAPLATPRASAGQAETYPQTGRQAPSGQPVLPSPRPVPPRIPRIIQWQGEPFAYLAKLGFNAIAMQRPASLQEMAKAQALGLSLICPPPTPDNIQAGILTNDFAPVIAWDLGSLESNDDLETASFVKNLLTRHDPDPQRQTIINPNRFVHEASRIADILLLGRPTLGTGMPLGDYATWLIRRKRLSRPGTPIWLQLDTEGVPGTSALRLETATAGEFASVTSRQRLATQVALAATLKTQGFYFTSYTPLTSKDPPTRSRALSLELTNLRIGLIEPWLASGKLITAARSNDPQLTAAVLQVERSFLMVPFRWHPAKPSAPNKPHRLDEPVSFLVPGVPESCDVYFLTPAGASRLRHRRVTGGIRIFFDNRIPDGFVLFTEDGRAFSSVARYIQQQSDRTTQRTRDLAELRLQQILPRYRTLSTPGAVPIQPWIRSTQILIEQCDTLLTQGNIEIAYQRAVTANRLLDEMDLTFARASGQHELRNASTSALAASPSFRGHPTSRPAAGARQLAPLSPASQNRSATLLETSFENITEFQQSGWHPQQLPTRGLTTAVRLSPDSPYQGSFCLELEVQPTGPMPPVVATSPVWVSSAPVRVRAGEKVEIRGMVRVPQRLTGSVDGLQIFDSLGGMPLAIRFQQTGSWQPFRVVRVAPTDTEMTITFALSGLGKAQIDQVSVRQLPVRHLQATRPPAPRLSPAR